MTQNVRLAHDYLDYRTAVLSPSSTKYNLSSALVIHNNGVKTIGERIKDLRKGRGLTQGDVGKAVGVTQEAISKLERTKGQIPMSDNLQALARFFDVDPDWLLTGKGSRKPVSSLSDEESELLLLYRGLSPVGQQYVLGRTKQVHADEYSRGQEEPPKPQEKPQETPRKRH